MLLAKVRKREKSQAGEEASDAQRQPQIKRQKGSQRSGSTTPPEFWDNLSKVPLCPRALRELDRRTIRPSSKPPKRTVLDENLVKQLKRFARRCGPSLRDIRGSPLSAKMFLKNLVATDAAFEQALIDRKMYPLRLSTSKPANLKELKERLARRRPSIESSFSFESFVNFTQRNDSVPGISKQGNNEAKGQAVLMQNVLPIFLGTNAVPCGQNHLFNNLESLTRQKSVPMPAYYNGSMPQDVHCKIRNGLGKYIVPCTDHNRPVLPNFFVELAVNDLRALALRVTRDLVIGARAMHKIQCYGRETPFDGNAYTLGAAYFSSGDIYVLHIYAMHPCPAGTDEEPSYHTTMIKSISMMDFDGARHGITAFRNAQDYAEEQRNRLIGLANGVAATQ